ncbi:6-phosphogluconolactonase [Sediminibacterium roseum]|nr:6-phosphogluconolactonase [Sediminibacterium roseum]
MREIQAEKLKVKIFDTREAMGQAAAKTVAAKVRELLSAKEEVNMIFAAAASQNEFLASLINENIEWNRVNAFHMDEYIGLPAGAKQLFGEWLKERIFSKVPFKNIFYLDGQAMDVDAECARYGNLLQQHPVDITCLGIGENAHLAFNDPHVADFNDTSDVKVVDLDEPCKAQQVREGCFASNAEVPPIAFTLTIPALLKAPWMYCMVPGIAKAEAVYHTLYDEISEQYPSTILRRHDGTILFLETESASRIKGERALELADN